MMTQKALAIMDRRFAESDRRTGASPGIRRLELVVMSDYQKHDESWQHADPTKWQTWYSLLEHCVDVSRVASMVASKHGRSPWDADLTRVAGLFHDIGKVQDACRAYRRCRVLSLEEKAVVDMHAGYSAKYVLAHFEEVRAEDRKFLRQMMVVVRNHHKPWRIFRRRLRRIAWDLRAVDTFVSHMENRHRPGLSQFLAIEVLQDALLAKVPWPIRIICRKEIASSIEAIRDLFSEESITASA